MRVAFLFIAALLAGCTSPTSDDDGTGDQAMDDRPGYRDGVVLINEEFTASAAQPAEFDVTFEEGAREVILEIQQDSGVLPNLHVEVEGCGTVDPPAAASWQSYPVCEEPSAGTKQVTISVKAGSPAGTGRFLIRADLPDP
jgi:hypothetical protein